MRLSNLIACTICSFATAIAVPATGQTPSQIRVSPAPVKAIQDWRAMRFGLFVHWGPVSAMGTEIGWSRGKQVPEKQYDKLYLKFNPQRFNADEWVATAKAAGTKYLVITSKHHDGFCIWDSKYTDYDITSTPFKRDVLKELSQACKQQGISFCTYHSICDWYHPDYALGSPGGKTKKPDPNMARYVQYLHNQTREIIENYGPLGIMWFDGEWEAPWTHEMGINLYRHIRSLQSDILINNRVDKGRRGMQGMTKSDEFLGDYDTPEQRVGGFNRTTPWESCITICRQWAWKPNDDMKSLKECVQTLLQVVGGDGNLLLNVGPMPDGRIEPRQVQRLKEIGQWLEQYGAGVYGTRGGPFKPGKWGASTCKGNKIYLFVMNWPANGPLRLPAIQPTIQSVRTLSGGEARVNGTAAGITLGLDRNDRNEVATVVELTIEGKAIDIEPIDVQSPSSRADETPAFKLHRIGSYRGEVCEAADFNNDKKLDVVAGEFIYLAPDFKPVKIRSIKTDINDQGVGYDWDFMNSPLDVDGDGKLDIVSCSWFGKQIEWYRNTWDLEGGKPSGGLWPVTVIHRNGNYECGELWDLDGDGNHSEIVPAVKATVWYEVARNAEGKSGMVRHVIDSDENKHTWGVGVGDVNGDGRPDVLRPSAWYEAPSDPRKGEWKEHPLAVGAVEEGKADHAPQILVYDVDADGVNDIITSVAHGYGIFWYRQVAGTPEPSWKRYLIDKSWSQAHSFQLADLDRDGDLDLVTGKRFMAHNGKDPGGHEPPGVYWYELQRDPKPKWIKHAISYDQGIGSGLNLRVVDLDADGDLDIVVTGKWGGPAWFENLTQ